MDRMLLQSVATTLALTLQGLSKIAAGDELGTPAVPVSEEEARKLYAEMLRGAADILEAGL